MASWWCLALLLSGLAGLIATWWLYHWKVSHEQARRQRTIRRHSLRWFQAQAEFLDAQRRSG